jgi:hypothetical protein
MNMTLEEMKNEVEWLKKEDYDHPFRLQFDARIKELQNMIYEYEMENAEELLAIEMMKEAGVLV